MAREILHTWQQPVYDARGRLTGHLHHTEYVERPGPAAPTPRVQATAMPTPAPRVPTPTLPGGRVFPAPDTLALAVMVQQGHRLPPLVPQAPEVPLPDWGAMYVPPPLNTFAEVVKRQQADNG